MKKILYFLCLLPLLATGQNLKINEIMVKNVSFNLDDGNNFSSWIEVYNSGATAENLNTYTFTRTTSSGIVKSWTPGSISVSPGGYAVVYFERQDSIYYIDNQSYLTRHASFKLDDPSGEKTGEIILTQGANQIDKVTYPAQYRNVSYGRQTDGTGGFVFFSEPSPASSNSDKAYVEPVANVSPVTEAPTFNLQPGFYSGSQSVSLSAENGATIYYTLTDGSVKVVAAADTGPWTVVGKGAEPTSASTVYSGPLTISDVRVIRAYAVAPGKLPSAVVTASYFVDQRKPELPVVSITISDDLMFTNEKGMYIKGADNSPYRTHDGVLSSTGAKSYETCSSRGGNMMEPWDRPANFEYFDKSGAVQINQEIELAMAGQCTRTNNFYKSMKIRAKDKYGSDKLPYDFFASKPGHKYSSIMLRSSGTEGPQDNSTMMMDAFMQSIAITGGMNIDCQAYQPAVLFVNGEYWGLVNVRERSNDSQIYSCYGYSDDDIYLLEGAQNNYPTPGAYNIPYEPYEKKQAYDVMYNFISAQDLSDPAKYAQACEMLDVDNFIDYLILFVYGQHCDWPQNNQKIWRHKESGKWRYFALDMDFTMSNLCGWTGTRTFACIRDAGCDGSSNMSQRLSAILKGLLKSNEFKARFLTRASYHANNALNATRLNALLDSLRDQIAPEITYFWPLRSHGGTWTNNVNSLRSAVNSRSAAILSEAKSFIGGASNTISLSSNLPSDKYVTYTFNGLAQRVNNTISYDIATNLPITVNAGKVEGYEFQGWYEFPDDTIIPKQATAWKYWSKSAEPEGWKENGYSDSGWSSGQAPLGFGSHGSSYAVSGYGTVKTKIPFNTSTKHFVTAYYRKTFNVSNLSSKSNFSVFLQVDDGAVVYLNGTEVYRLNFPTDYEVTHCSFTNAGNPTAVTFEIPKSLINEGENVIQIEVHQWEGGNTAYESTECLTTSNDSWFELMLSCKSNDITNAINYSEVPDLTHTVSGKLDLTAYYAPCETCVSKKVYINEVYSAGNPSNEDADWIELYNGENEEVDLSGYTITRINSGALKATYTIPDGTTIPAKGFIVFDREEYGFGISHNEDYTLILTDIYENDIDIFAVDAATLATTYGESTGRKPDGVGEIHIITTVDVTKGDWNDPTDIKLVAGNETLKVYPNPVKEFVNIEAGSAIRSIVITDIAGRTLLRTVGNGSTQTVVPTQTLSGGVYLLTVETEKGKGVSRILK